MPDLVFWLNVIAVPGLLITGAILTLTVDWRVSFAALAVQYALVAILLTQTVDVPVATVKVISGMLVVMILTLTGRQVDFARMARARRDVRSAVTQLTDLRDRFAQLRRIELQTNFPFRVVAVLLAAAIAGYLVVEQGIVFPGVPLGLTFAGGLLAALGLLSLGLTEEPMNVGMGLLMALSGFELIYLSLERSVAVVALLAGVHFGLAIAVSYLALLRYAAATE
ncbi:MAG: hypothetical protein ACT4QE_16500 [Anaerolineales bacterium]